MAIFAQGIPPMPAWGRFNEGGGNDANYSAYFDAATKRRAIQLQGGNWQDALMVNTPPSPLSPPHLSPGVFTMEFERRSDNKRLTGVSGITPYFQNNDNGAPEPGPSSSSLDYLHDDGAPDSPVFMQQQQQEQKQSASSERSARGQSECAPFIRHLHTVAASADRTSSTEASCRSPVGTKHMYAASRPHLYVLVWAGSL
eukprot:jgi/Mesen1/2927/ME000175S02081